MTRVKSGSGKGFALTVAAIAVFVIVAVIAVSALRGSGANADGDARQIEIIPVPATPVRYEDQTRISALFPGLITARRQSALGFPSGGQIAEILVDVGDRVEEGAAPGAAGYARLASAAAGGPCGHPCRSGAI